MGQAKRRGTYEERRLAAITKAGIEREEKRRLDLERKLRMTEEWREGALLFAQIMAMAGAYMPYSVRRWK